MECPGTREPARIRRPVQSERCIDKQKRLAPLSFHVLSTRYSRLTAPHRTSHTVRSTTPASSSHSVQCPAHSHHAHCSLRDTLLSYPTTRRLFKLASCLGPWTLNFFSPASRTIKCTPVRLPLFREFLASVSVLVGVRQRVAVPDFARLGGSAPHPGRSAFLDPLYSHRPCG